MGDSKRQLAERVEDLSRTRSGAVDAHDSDLRGVERDLHDGTQAQLVSLATRLGLAFTATTVTKTRRGRPESQRRGVPLRPRPPGPRT